MYNNFSSKKTKKVISALLASALVVTSAPITADAATTKVVGVSKTFSITKKASAKVSGLSKAEKKVVKVTISKNKKKVTVKGLKAGSATFKVGKKAYTVRVTKVTSIKKKTFATTLTAKSNKKVSVTVNGTNVKYDKVTWTSSNKKVVAVSKATTTVSSKKVASNTLKPLKKGTATITVKSKATGKSLKVKVTVKAATTATTAPSTAPSVTPATTPAVSATPEATATVTPATTPAVSATPDASATPATTPAVSATPEASASAIPATTPAVSATPEVSSAPSVSADPSANPSETPAATPEVTTGGTIAVTGAAVAGATVKVVSGTTVVYEGTVEGLEAKKLDAGTYVVTVSKEGYDNVTTTAVVVDNQTVTVEADLVETVVVPPAASASSITGAAVGSKVIQVSFDQPVTSTGAAAVAFVVTKGTGTTETTETVVSSEWIDKQNVKLTLANSVADTTYSVKATEVGGTALTTSFTAVAAKDTTLTIDDDMIEVGNATATVDITLKNNYGESKSTSGVTAVAYNVNKAKSVTATVNEGKVSFDTTDAADFSVNDVITLTLTKGDLVASKKITVANKKVAQDVEIGAHTLKNTKETKLISVTANDSNKFYLPISFVDQYGNKSALATSDFSGKGANTASVTLDNGAIITSSDGTVIGLENTTVGSDKKPLFVVNASTGTNAGKKVTITVTIPATGVVKTYTVTVYAQREAAKITGFSTTGTNTLATTKVIEEGKDFALAADDFTYVDQYGDVIASDDASVRISDFKAKDTTSIATTGGTTTVADYKAGSGAIALATTANKSIVTTAVTAAGTETVDASTSLTVTNDDTNAIAGSTGINIIGLQGGNETVTFIYAPTASDLSDTYAASSFTTNFKVIAAVNSVNVTADKTEYIAGDTATLTFTAKKVDGNVNTDYTDSEWATVTVGTKKYSRQFTFTNGVATVQVPVTQANATLAVGATVAGKSASGTVNVKPAALEKYDLAFDSTATTTLNITAVDKYGNTVTSIKGSKVATLNITSVNVSTATPPVTTTKDYALDDADSENKIVLNFTAGVAQIETFTLKDNYKVPASGTTTNTLSVVIDDIENTLEVTLANSANTIS